MSTNVVIFATRDVLVIKTGEKSKQIIEFDAQQTPTKMTYKIINSANPIKTYKEYILNSFEDEYEDVYHEDDIFCEKKPISQKKVNYGKLHIKKLDDWLTYVENEGYDVIVESI